MPISLIPFLQLAGAFLIWSSWLIPIRFLRLNAFTISLFTCFWASIFWGLYCLIKAKDSILLNKGQYLKLFLLSLFFILNMLTYLGALKYATAAVAVLTHYIAPVFVAIMAPIFLKERLTYRIIVGLGLSVIGFVIIFYSRENMGGDYIKGALLGLASGVFYAVIIILAKKALIFIKEEVLLFYQNLFSVFIFFPLLPYINISFQLGDFFIMAILAFVYSVVASILYIRALKRVEGIRVSIIGYFEPLGTIIWGFVFFKENITIKTIIGGLLILFSGYLVSKRE